jgi:hypothetical protein
MSMDKEERMLNVNDRRVQFIAWPPSTDIKDTPSWKSQEMCKVVIHQDIRDPENQEDKHKDEQFMKKAHFLKMFVLIMMTLGTFGIFVCEGSICMSK